MKTVVTCFIKNLEEIKQHVLYDIVLTGLIKTLILIGVNSLKLGDY